MGVVHVGEPANSVETLGDDNCWTNIPLGFTFNGFGASVAAISVSTNGVLFFGQNCSTAFFNSSLPTSISGATVASDSARRSFAE